MRALTKLIVLTETAIAAVVRPLTLGIAFVTRRGRYSSWRRKQRRSARTA